MSATAKPAGQKASDRSAELVEKLRTLTPGKVLPNFIAHIRFPRFKNINPGARVDFEFPVTALVGPNGCGKTSALHALYGAPKGKSTSDFWFATDVDPIKEGDGQPNRFIYGHWLAGVSEPVETRKARVGSARHRRPGYFEPTKAVIGDGMDMTPFPATGDLPGQAKDRWNPVERPLLYMNFRSELSAFDKYLFWGNLRRTKTLNSRHDRLQLGARRLKRAIDSGKADFFFRKHQMVFENRDLNVHELSVVCQILGKQYSEARLIRHKYYGNDEGLSVRFRTASAIYSEAFAGSGELAVASLVVKLWSAEPGSLVLLDEPEVSLHPAAQERLLIFLMEEVLRKKHQIVFTTHSPSLILNLPSEAIKVFYEVAGGRFDVLNKSHPYAAFTRLGAPLPNRVRVLVEDRLAKKIVQLALQNLDETERPIFEIGFLSGGAQSYFANRIPTLMHETNAPFLLLDGDRRPGAEFPDPSTIPTSENHSLEKLIGQLTNCKNIQLSADGAEGVSATDRLIALRRQYLGFLHSNVFFLPRACPEAIVLHALDHETPADSKSAKAALADLVFKLTGSNSSEEIDNFAWANLSTKRVGNEDLESIADSLRTFLSKMQTV